MSLSKTLQRWFSQAHGWLYRKTGGRLIWLGDQLVLVTTTGARTGETRTRPLFGFRHGEGWVVVAAAPGEHNPGWYHNMVANPDVVVERKGRSCAMVAHEAAGAERGSIWKSVIEEEPAYASLQERTSRVIPVMVLEPVTGETAAQRALVTASAATRQHEEGSTE